MTPTVNCERFIQGWENCSLTPYLDAVGRWTNGRGHLLREGEPRYPWTQEVADARFHEDLAKTASCVEDSLMVPVTQQEFDALCALTYNIGESAFANSTLCKRINTMMRVAVPAEWRKWNKGRKDGRLVEMAGLVKRREGELLIWRSGNYEARP